MFHILLRCSVEDWRAKENEIVTRLVNLKEYARGRGTEVHAVLIQSDRDAPSGPATSRGPQAAQDERALNDHLNERVISMRRRVGLESTSVSVLFRSDVSGAALTAGFSPHVGALEGALRDKAAAYYRGRARHCKSKLALAVPVPVVGAT